MAGLTVNNGSAFVKPKNFNVHDGVNWLKAKAVHHFDVTQWIKDWSSGYLYIAAQPTSGNVQLYKMDTSFNILKTGVMSGVTLGGFDMISMKVASNGSIYVLARAGVSGGTNIYKYNQTDTQIVLDKKVFVSNNNGKNTIPLWLNIVSDRILLTSRADSDTGYGSVIEFNLNLDLVSRYDDRGYSGDTMGGNNEMLPLTSDTCLYATSAYQSGNNYGYFGIYNLNTRRTSGLTAREATNPRLGRKYADGRFIGLKYATYSENIVLYAANGSVITSCGFGRSTPFYGDTTSDYFVYGNSNASYGLTVADPNKPGIPIVYSDPSTGGSTKGFLGDGKIFATGS